jgi:hypothetical protein
MADGLTVKLTPLTRDGNCKQWAGQVRSLLIVATRLDKLLDREPAGEEEVEKDIVCKARLMLCVSGPLRDIVDRAGSAKDAWDALQEEYLGDLHAKKPKLMADVTALSQEGRSVIEYIDKAKELRDQFESVGMSESLPLLCHKYLSRFPFQTFRSQLGVVDLQKEVFISENMGEC